MRYLIDVPPPTISGNLHMGHLFSYAQMDFIARYQEMKGKKLLYPFCYDNNGIPTERLANKSGVTNPEEILKMSHSVSEDYKRLFSDLHMNWSSETYNTFDNIAQQVAIKSYEDLLNKNLIYEAEETYRFCETTQKSIPEDAEHEYETIIKKGKGLFIKVLPYKEQLKEQVEKIVWKPERFKKTILNWIDSIDRDWSVGRERQYGISVPNSNLKFDTWFTSSLTPQIAWSCLVGEPMLDVPVFDIRFQAHDIINTWALFTIIKSYHHNKQIPWKEIVITGHAVTKKGDKLSKSKGNFTDPYYYFNTFGTTGIRYWAASSPVGADTLLSDHMLAHGKRWEIKIANAQKFIEYQKKNNWLGIDDEKLSIWKDTKKQIDKFFDDNDFYKAFVHLDTFFWNGFCGTWIEESKKESFSLTLETILHEMKNYYRIFFPEK